MNKSAIIFHGTGGKPTYCWYQWLESQLSKKGYRVEVPHYPEINKESIITFLPRVLANHIFREDTVLIGHSAGSALILSILENINVQISQAVLVAGYATSPNQENSPVLQEHYDWEKIKSHVHDIYFINSVSDPYGCDDKQGRYMFDHIGGSQIIMNEGHFGAPGQSYKQFPLLDKLIL